LRGVRRGRGKKLAALHGRGGHKVMVYGAARGGASEEDWQMIEENMWDRNTARIVARQIWARRREEWNLDQERADALEQHIETACASGKESWVEVLGELGLQSAVTYGDVLEEAVVARRGLAWDGGIAREVLLGAMFFSVKEFHQVEPMLDAGLLDSETGLRFLAALYHIAHPVEVEKLVEAIHDRVPCALCATPMKDLRGEQPLWVTRDDGRAVCSDCYDCSNDGGITTSRAKGRTEIAAAPSEAAHGEMPPIARVRAWDLAAPGTSGAVIKIEGVWYPPRNALVLFEPGKASLDDAPLLMVALGMVTLEAAPFVIDPQTSIEVVLYATRPEDHASVVQAAQDLRTWFRERGAADDRVLIQIETQIRTRAEASRLAREAARVPPEEQAAQRLGLPLFHQPVEPAPPSEGAQTPTVRDPRAARMQQLRGVFSGAGLKAERLTQEVLEFALYLQERDELEAEELLRRFITMSAIELEAEMEGWRMRKAHEDVRRVTQPGVPVRPSEYRDRAGLGQRAAPTTRDHLMLGVMAMVARLSRDAEVIESAAAGIPSEVNAMRERSFAGQFRAAARRLSDLIDDPQAEVIAAIARVLNVAPSCDLIEPSGTEARVSLLRSALFNVLDLTEGSTAAHAARDALTKEASLERALQGMGRLRKQLGGPGSITTRTEIRVGRLVDRVKVLLGGSINLTTRAEVEHETTVVCGVSWPRWLPQRAPARETMSATAQGPAHVTTT
jgi:hypothetical protein